MSTSKKKILEIIEIPSSTEVEIDNSIIKITGPKGTLERELSHPFIKISKENNAIRLEQIDKKTTKKSKKMLMTFKSHIKNMIVGVSEGFTYHLKIVSGHFPISVSLESNNKVVIKNFLGEKVPRVAHINPNTKATIKGDEITIESIDIESAGQSAANIESATRITNRDRRIFQDGVYIVQKPSRRLK